MNPAIRQQDRLWLLSVSRVLLSSELLLLSDQHFHYFRFHIQKLSFSLFAIRLGDTNLSKELKKVWFMHNLMQNKKKSRWNARNFGNARNGQKTKFWPSPGSVWIGTLRGKSQIVWCPSTIRTRFPYYHNTQNQVICIYLLETFCFCFALADIVYFLHSRLGEIHRKWPVRFL